jgi:hypothetical protein
MFNPSMTHKDVAKSLTGKIIGAGFCIIKADQGHDGLCTDIRCYGESTSLGIKSRPEDEKLINSLLHYY